VADAIQDRKSNLAQVYYSSGRYLEALKLLQEVLKEANRELPHVRCRIALCLLALGRIENAEPMAQKVVAEFPAMPLAKFLVGQIKAARGDAMGALALFSEVQEHDSRLPFLHVQIGQIHLRQRRWPEAEAAFRKALEIDDDCAEAHDGLGVVMRERGQINDAIFEHMRAASLMHYRAQTHVNLGIALANAKQIDWAIRAFSVAVELAPEQPFPHRCLAQLYRRAKQDAEKAREHTIQAWELRRKLRGKPPAFTHGA
jgi:tetratricopeptide (TPR) repeat protein